MSTSVNSGRRPASRRRAAAAALAGRGMLAVVSAAALAVGVVSGVAQGASRVPFAAAGVMRAACAPPQPGFAQCLTLYRPQADVNHALTVGAAATPAGLSPADLQAAYDLPAGRDPHQTVALIDAFDTPALARYVAVYRQQYRLPSCGAGCLRKVNQDGKPAPLPAPAVRTGWDLETVLDADMVSAACPYCKILIVEARSSSIADLSAAAATAARLGARVISNSYGGPESGQVMTYARDFQHPGHVYVAASGDKGFGPASFPASAATVTAVGGTQLTRADNKRGWTEQVWNDQVGASGSGCSAYMTKPAWQHDSHCRMRTVADVSAAAADIPIYEKDYGGWLTVEGTSAATPLIAAVYALAENAATVTARYTYTHAGALYDITAGTNDWNAFGSHGSACGNDYLCVAQKGYDAPAGLGTPHGTGAF